jgi:hypothetical protein
VGEAICPQDEHAAGQAPARSGDPPRRRARRGLGHAGRVGVSAAPTVRFGCSSPGDESVPSDTRPQQSRPPTRVAAGPASHRHASRCLAGSPLPRREGQMRDSRHRPSTPSVPEGVGHWGPRMGPIRARCGSRSPGPDRSWPG